jgi:hypothetical protein
MDLVKMALTQGAVAAGITPVKNLVGHKFGKEGRGKR